MFYNTLADCIYFPHMRGGGGGGGGVRTYFYNIKRDPLEFSLYTLSLEFPRNSLQDTPGKWLQSQTIPRILVSNHPIQYCIMLGAMAIDIFSGGPPKYSAPPPQQKVFPPHLEKFEPPSRILNAQCD